MASQSSSQTAIGIIAGLKPCIYPNQEATLVISGPSQVTTLLSGQVFMHLPQAKPFWFVKLTGTPFNIWFHISYPLNIILSPQDIALHGHSRAHLKQLEQNF